MRILSVHIYRYDLPLARPLVLQGCRVESRSGLVLKLTGEHGIVGWGEASPLPGFSPENLQRVTDSALQLPRALEGRTLSPLFVPLTDRIRTWLGGFDAPPSLQFAIDSALLHLLAQWRGVPLCRLLSKRPLTHVSLNALLTGSRDEIVERAARLRDEGYRAAKLKVGRGRVQDNIETVRVVREALGDTIALRLDANRAWDYDTATQFARGIEDCVIEYIEEPLNEPSHLIDFAGRTGLPVALDETIAEHGARDLETWRGAKAAILKPTILGGVETTNWLAKRACNAGMTPVFSSTFETGLGLTVLANMAAAFYAPDISVGDGPVGPDTTAGSDSPIATGVPRDSDIPIGLDTHDWFTLDLLDGGWPIRNGQLDIAALNAGCGGIREGILQEVPYA